MKKLRGESGYTALLIIIVYMALDDDLLAKEDELILSLFREVLLGQELLNMIDVVGGLIFVLLRDTFYYSITYSTNFIH